MKKQYHRQCGKATANADEPLRVAVGNRLRDVRLRKNISLERLHELGGPHPHHMSQIENGCVDFLVVTMFRVAHLLEVPVEALFVDDVDDELLGDTNAALGQQLRFLLPGNGGGEA